MDIEGIDVDKDFEEKLSQTSKASRPRLASAVETKMQIILKVITDFGNQNKLSLKEISNISQDAYNNVANAEKMHNMSQLQAATQMIENITKNAKTATDPMKLLYNIGITKPHFKAPSETSSFPVLPLGSEGDELVPSEIMDLDTEAVKEPKISQSQLDHIKEVVEILKKHPKLKDDIRRTITEELTKGYINPEQFKEYNQAIELENIKEAPPAIRVKKVPKPKGKKSAQTDKAIIPMDIEISSKLPKGKPIKNNQKKKPKIVTL